MRSNLILDCSPFPDVYDELLGSLLDSTREERNVRTGARIKMLDGGTSFKLDLTDLLVPVTGTRKLYPHVAAAEVAWFLRGERDVTWLEQYTQIWSKFVEEGYRNVDAAYGYRWRRHFGRDQVKLAIEALRKNPTDRRVWVQAWDPSSDGLGAEGQRNVPCPVGFTLSLVDNMLHSSLFIRSSDVFVGLPYDVMGHAMLMAIAGASVGAHTLGTMQVTLAHPHLYEHHVDMAQACLVQTRFTVGPSLYAWDLDMVERDPDGYVWAYRKAAKEVQWPAFQPKPELIL